MRYENFSTPDLLAITFASVGFLSVLIVGGKALIDNFKNRNK